MIGWILFVAWFALGVWFAPRAAALNWRFNDITYKDIKMTEAKLVFFLTVFIGPAMMVYYAVRVFMFGSNKKISGSRFEKILIKHDKNYREEYLEEQKSRIRQLERDNKRLTAEVLGK